ncbi:hypothetical protein C3B54_11770 [Pontimonas salivibrio]|jgi:hypothetical protein|uniref:Uncharacterized protein n=1 Tax=Pontimonas salivibrio TaxID=1159327 RepID=A0A2L2BPZ8_9MICO|nr:hypothetical protein [Pontimonas salivibrio]AVG23750.1 hypothetical protein C3B54_11770 [Pontimonas salivibrio]
MEQAAGAVVLAAEVVNELPVPAIVYGLGFLVAFIALAFVTYSYRNVANRHRSKGGSHQGGQH